MDKKFKEKIKETIRLWDSIIQEEIQAIKNQPDMTEEEWFEFRKSHKKNRSLV